MRGGFIGVRATAGRAAGRTRCRSGRAVAICALLAGGCTRAPEPATAPVEAAEPAAPASDAPSPAPGPTPVEATSETPAPGPRACGPGERLDSGCTCRSGGACFDICCGEDARCAHPARPGGKSACLLATPPAAPRQQRACEDGEALADGCRCDGKRCMDLCCVGSACSHHASPDGGWAKCVKVR